MSINRRYWQAPAKRPPAGRASGQSGTRRRVFVLGRSHAEVARELEISRQSAHLGHARFTQGGVEALRSRSLTDPDGFSRSGSGSRRDPRPLPPTVWVADIFIWRRTRPDQPRG